MRTLVASLLAVFLTFTLAVDQVEAKKRFGGGSSLGKSYSTPKKTSPSSTDSATSQQKTSQTANNTQAQPKKKSGLMGGLLGGLLAGGLLAALFAGGAFEGIQFMDILLVGLLAFIGFKLFAMFRQQRQPQYATGNAQYEIRPEPMKREAPQPQPEEPKFSPMPAYNGGGFSGDELKLPQWFDKEGFVEGARQHFTLLQKAWDNCDWDEIKTYTSAELLEQLKAERAKLPEQQHTEVVSVMAELVNFIDNNDHVIVSINFYGWLKEEGDETTEFNETWHLSRDTTEQNSDWFIVGIEQQ
ncbi:Tim44 domain-containing protein [Marinobacterium jannaschii]|uniref:Tim44 domain-containing protein n=1 Tax=Marinobacterium jannaschii TaxID=64970 RepID=UPI00048905E9|nr:TIM44-like domain-containing protein [Marinobacterium jannaschii]